MRSLYVLLLFALATTTIQAQDVSIDEESVDLEALYQKIDEVISESPQYVAEREQHITVCRDSFLKAESPEQRFLKAEELFHLYQPYRNDSALYYADLCISLAESIHRPDLAGRFRSLLALQCSNTGMEAESLDQLRLVKRSALDNKSLVAYYNAWMHVCGELASYTQRATMRKDYFDKQNLYRDSVMMVAAEGSEEWLHLKMDILSAQRHFQGALATSYQWLKSVKEGTHERAYAAFYRSMVYEHLGNHDLACYWLGKSALDDIRCAVMNQASLLFLAEHLANDGDISRALRYMEFSKECNTTFCPNLRAYQFSSVINVIEKSRVAALHRAKLIFIVAAAVIALLILLLVIVIVRLSKVKK